MDKKLNQVFDGALAIFIVGNMMNILRQLFFINNSLYNHESYYTAIGCSVIMIVILSAMLRKKRNAASFFFAFQYINALAVSVMDGGYIIHLTVATLISAVMAGLLCLKEDGISGWKIFYPSKG